MNGSWWCICWRFEGLPYLFDTDSAAFAGRIAVMLSEWGREDVHVAEVEWTMPEGMMERVKTRVLAAVAAKG